MNIVVLFPRYIDNKPSVDPKVYFLLHPQAFNRHLKTQVDNKSSMHLVVYFLKLLINI